MMHVCIGGTFNIFHKGHQLLIQTAVQTAGQDGYLFIGIASGDLVQNKPQLRPIQKRKEKIESYLSTLEHKPTLDIEPITNIYGPTLTHDFHAIIVSPETKKTAEHINHKRRQKGYKPMTIIQIPHVLAQDGKPIQSSRIITGEINPDGSIKNKQN